MKVFIGSSHESYDDLREVASWLEELEFEPLPWDSPHLFLPGASTLLELLEIASRVDAAVFIFAEDDQVWYRQDSIKSPRDNVLVEYGLFVGRLGPQRAIVCRKGTPRQPSDLAGITYVDISADRRHNARLRLLAWARSIGKPIDDPAFGELVLQREVLRREADELQSRLIFAEQTNNDLQEIIREKVGVDFREMDLSSADGYWKLLFDFEFFRSAVAIIASRYPTPDAWRAVVGDLMRMHPTPLQLNNPDRTAFYTSKTIRSLRRFEDHSAFARLAARLDEDLRVRLESLARQRAVQLAEKRAQSAEP